MTSNHLLKRSLINRLNKLSNKRKNQEGFTLIEILTVVIILGILSALVIPAMLNQQATARVNAANDAAMNVARACAQLQVTGRQAEFVMPVDDAGNALLTGTCTAEGTATTFTSGTTDIGVTQPAISSITADGQVSITQCAQNTAWAPINDPYCNSET